MNNQKITDLITNLIQKYNFTDQDKKTLLGIITISVYRNLCELLFTLGAVKNPEITKKLILQLEEHFATLPPETQSTITEKLNLSLEKTLEDASKLNP